MPTLRVGVIDLVCNSRFRPMFQRLLASNTAGIMPQAIAVWCAREGCEVEYCSWSGSRKLSDLMPRDVDVAFISAFTYSAQLAYALSNLYRTHGTVTVLGGPHARAFPVDALKYFDYVLGITDRELITDLLRDHRAAPQSSRFLSAESQPEDLPGVRERWEYLSRTTQRALFLKMVPMLSSFGCPYSCDFCPDADIPWRLNDLETIREDLRFLLRTRRRPRVVWFDPTFPVHSEEFLAALEEVVPPGAIDFIGESTLSVLDAPRLRRLKELGFRALTSGVEAWSGYAYKTGNAGTNGAELVEAIAEKANLILRHIPYLCLNFIIGLDACSGPESFEMTRTLIDAAPGIYPGYLFLVAFGRNASGNARYYREGRVLPLPFHFLEPRRMSNVRPERSSWIELYDHAIDLLRYSFSARAIWRRISRTDRALPKGVSLMQSLSTGGRSKLRYQQRIRELLERDRQFRDYFEQETTILPDFFRDTIRRDLGPLWEWLPPGALRHDLDVPPVEAGQVEEVIAGKGAAARPASTCSSAPSCGAR
jgi:radical SAM superfamily enzyme YgiQ (UPF0313 family)